ncbi:hypothetical protein BSKO_13968 [Bryopsis sp. KO-2023]|nr:hypothetical protein BSKO_13968 [Bryopsis sp. KO-2023]
MTTLISFDVDGTLVTSVGDAANKLHRRAFANSFKEIFGIETTIDVVKHHGSTDPLIILAVLKHHGIPLEKAKARLSDLQASMIKFFQDHQSEAAQGLRLLPGVKELLETLQADPNVATCLVTGNLQPIGWGKMRALGIEHLFSPQPFGGFGSDFCSGNIAESWKDRSELVGIAAKRAEELVEGPVVRRFHIGDAPMDMMAAEGAGATPVGVTTGIFSKQQLEESVKPETNIIVLEGLAEPAKVKEALNLNNHHTQE